MHPTDKAARVGGAIYPLLVFACPSRSSTFPALCSVRGNATATVNNIASSARCARVP